MPLSVFHLVMASCRATSESSTALVLRSASAVPEMYRQRASAAAGETGSQNIAATSISSSTLLRIDPPFGFRLPRAKSAANLADARRDVTAPKDKRGEQARAALLASPVADPIETRFRAIRTVQQKRRTTHRKTADETHPQSGRPPYQRGHRHSKHPAHRRHWQQCRRGRYWRCLGARGGGGARSR